MSSKNIDNNHGTIHTLEAIIGVAIIIGTTLFTTNISPYEAQRTGEHSKVQLVNIGRDILDLIELTPITDIFNNYSKSQGVRRDYNLTANRTYIRPNEPINFTVYYIDTEDIVYENLVLEQTVLGLKNPINTTTIYGTTIWSFSGFGEYNIRAYKGSANSPIAWSNYVTIKVGYYFLETNINGIYKYGDLNVSGVVYDINGSGVSNLTIKILDFNRDSISCTSSTVNNSIKGNFSFVWPTCLNSGTYYLQAIDKDGISSNMYRIIYSSQNTGGVICCDAVINETESTIINLTYSRNNFGLSPINTFNINQVQYTPNCNICDRIDLTLLDSENVVFTGYVAGDYYIFYGNVGGGSTDPANAAKTNGIRIRVLPLQGRCIFAECRSSCSGLSMTNLTLYMRIFMPPNVNYNLYLINPDGTLCKDCPEFKEIINGYPTDEAVAVNKIFHLKTMNGEYLRELRMVLWYK